MLKPIVYIFLTDFSQTDMHDKNPGYFWRIYDKSLNDSVNPQIGIGARRSYWQFRNNLI